MEGISKTRRVVATPPGWFAALAPQFDDVDDAESGEFQVLHDDRGEIAEGQFVRLYPASSGISWEVLP